VEVREANDDELDANAAHADGGLDRVTERDGDQRRERDHDRTELDDRLAGTSF
jgi:hypothetical protein